MVRLIQEFDLLSAECERLEKEAADEAVIGVAKAAALNASVPPVIPATEVPEAMMVDVSKYVPVPFTGTGEPQTLLQEFRNWKGKWSLAERKLKTYLMSRMRSFRPSSSCPVRRGSRNGQCSPGRVI